MNSEKIEAEMSFDLARNSNNLEGFGDSVSSSKSEHTKPFSELNPEETHAISGGATPTGYPFTYSSGQNGYSSSKND
ncbi:MAG: hypothetical protein F6K42_11125 [Leptolyngbya sp. SIO1D8]|nr:hypothetical protein [Leptolyngbya sp. SIO1D8]